MEGRRLKISKKASRKIEAQTIWYYQHCDRDFIKAMLKNISEDITSLLAMPTIGRFIKTKGRHEYRAFVSHKKCIILYWYDDNTLSVTDVIFTDTHSQRIF